jgi:uncharacterized protein YjcR
VINQDQQVQLDLVVEEQVVKELQDQQHVLTLVEVVEVQEEELLPHQIFQAEQVVQEL